MSQILWKDDEFEGTAKIANLWRISRGSGAIVPSMHSPTLHSKDHECEATRDYTDSCFRSCPSRRFACRKQNMDAISARYRVELLHPFVSCLERHTVASSVSEKTKTRRTRAAVNFSVSCDVHKWGPCVMICWRFAMKLKLMWQVTTSPFRTSTKYLDFFARNHETVYRTANILYALNSRHTH